MLTSPIRNFIPAWQVLVGWIPPDLIEQELERGAPLLVVPNHDEQRRELSDRLKDHPRFQACLAPELLGSRCEQTNWYRYSDGRFDGVTPPQQLQPLVPNLRLLDVLPRAVIRLDTLIERWMVRQPEITPLIHSSGGRLWLHCKLPDPIVAGATGILEHIAELCWTPLGSLRDSSAQDQAWMRGLEAGLFQPVERRSLQRQSPTVSLIWQQDPARLAAQRQRRIEQDLAHWRLRSEDQARDLAQARLQHQELEQALGQLRLRNQELERALREQRDAAKALQTTLLGMEASLADLTRQRGEQDLRLAELQETAASRLADLETLRQERDTLAAEHSACLAELEQCRRPMSPAPRQPGDLRLCQEPSDPAFGTLQMLVSSPGGGSRWEAAVAPDPDSAVQPSECPP